GNPYYPAQFPGAAAPALQQANFPQQTGSVAAGAVGFGWRDVLISKVGSTVEWFIAGLKIATISNATFTASNIFVGYWDSYASVSDNAALSFGLVDNVRVERLFTNVPPYITASPESAEAATGNNIPFNVAAGGTPALAYQWRFNGTNLAGATSSSYTRLNAQAIHAGNYSVVVTNASGSITSAVAILTLTPSIPLEFTSIAALPDGKVTLGVTGDPGFNVLLQTSTNLVDWSALTNLVNPTGTLSFTNPPAPGVPYQFFRALYP
ncbi:MAG: immunoglobulin domain-containing protein, partial [Verrucomicrobiota bacterium]